MKAYSLLMMASTDLRALKETHIDPSSFVLASTERRFLFDSPRLAQTFRKISESSSQSAIRVSLIATIFIEIVSTFVPESLTAVVVKALRHFRAEEVIAQD
jgi:hypothetical protein